MKRFAIIAMAAALVVPAMAAETFSDTQWVWDYMFVNNSNQTATASWAHNIPGDAIGNTTSASLTIASLLFDVNDDLVTVALNDVVLGTLTGSITTFDETNSDILSTLTQTSLGASATLTFTWDNWLDRRIGFDHVAIVSSTLCGVYEIAGDMAVVPAPGAVLLAGIGTTLVGWLRRRRSI